MNFFEELDKFEKLCRKAESMHSEFARKWTPALLSPAQMELLSRTKDVERQVDASRLKLIEFGFENQKAGASPVSDLSAGNTEAR